MYTNSYSGPRLLRVTRADALINRTPPPNSLEKCGGYMENDSGLSNETSPGGGLPQFSKIIVVYVTDKGHIHRYMCNSIKPHAMTIYQFMFHA